MLEKEVFDLDDTQMKAVEHTGSPLLVTAGPGSGKTSVITGRIKFLIRDDGLDPSEIMCLTFSEKAAADLRSKLENDTYYTDNKIDLSEMQVSTYHAFCRKLLLDNTSSTGLSMSGGVLDRSLFLVWGVQNIDKFGFDEHVEIGNNSFEIIESMIDGISVFAQELISPEDLEEYVSKKLSDTSTIVDPEDLDYTRQLNNLVKIYKKYIEFKKEIDVMDYDDLIVEANKLLQDSTHPNVLTSVQKNFKHILIDEFQDNNFAQFEIVKKISTGGNVTAVGDSDQNIYRFQGAYTQIFEDFKRTYPNHTEILLSNNYRNPESVIKLSGELMDQDGARAQKDIIGVKNGGEKVKVVECTSDFAQVEYIKNRISQLMNENPSYSFGDFAILSRKQKYGLKVAQMLVAESIPVKYIGKSKVHASSGVQVVMAFLRIIADPMNSMTSIVRLLQEYGVTEQNISRINLAAKKRAREKKDGDYAFDVLSDLDVGYLTQKKEIADVFSKITDFIDIAKDNPPSQLLYQIIRNKTDIYKKVANDSSIDSFIERSILTDILNNTYDFEKIVKNPTVKEFLDFSSMIEQFDIETRNDKIDNNSVQVSTIHKSKGLEFKVVFVIDVATYIMPMRFSQDEFYVPPELSKGVRGGNAKDEHKREERRILYVAMTRAIDHLHISYPKRYGDGTRSHRESKLIQPLNLSKNNSVELVKHDSQADTGVAEPQDAVDVIKNEYVKKALQNINSNQWRSAVQKIVELAKISHFKENKTLDGFESDDLLKYEQDDGVEKKLNGVTPETLGFEKDNMSFSKFSDYENCPKMFWYKHVLNALPENFSNPSMAKGNFFHKILQDSATRDGGKADTLKDLLGYLDTKWDSSQYLSHPVQKETQDKESLVPALESYHKWNSNNKNDLKKAELDFEMHIGGFLIKGKIDRVEETPDGEFVIVDYKTGGKTKNVGDVSKNLQLNMYCMALRSKKGYMKLPKYATLFYVEKPDGEQLFEYVVDVEKMDAAKEKLEGFAESITSKNFHATPDMKKCGWCEFADICKESKK